jgi:UDP-N-acetyl-D-mannosaminuronate dehydrogenase
MKKADIGLIGLAVMGENLILNMESKGFTVACYNRTVSKVDDFVNGRGKGKNIIGCHSIEELAKNLEKTILSSSLSRISKKGILLLTVATPIFPIRLVVLNILKAKGCSTSGPVSPAVKKAL